MDLTEVISIKKEYSLEGKIKIICNCCNEKINKGFEEIHTKYRGMQDEEKMCFYRNFVNEKKITEID